MDIETLALAKGYTNKQIKKLSVNGIKGDKGDPGKDAVIDTTLSNSGEAADAKVVGNEISSLKEEKVNKPNVTDNGKVARAKDGDVEWVSVGQPTDEQTATAVSVWLDEHPEVTTTVQDGSVSEPKIQVDFLRTIKNEYVTPEMFGAVGDGVQDDTQALQRMVDSGSTVFSVDMQKKYKTSSPIIIPRLSKDFTLLGTIIYYGDDFAIKFTCESTEDGSVIGRVADCNINIGSIYSKNGGCIAFYPKNENYGYVAGLNMSGKVFSAKTTGILIEGNGWFNENIIRDINFSAGQHAIYCVLNKGEVSRLTFSRCHFEGVENGCYFDAGNNNLNSIYFNDCRMNEAISEYFIKVNNVRNVIHSFITLIGTKPGHNSLKGDAIYLYVGGTTYINVESISELNNMAIIYDGKLINIPVYTNGFKSTTIPSDATTPGNFDLSSKLDGIYLRSNFNTAIFNVSVLNIPFTFFQIIPIKAWACNYTLNVQCKTKNVSVQFDSKSSNDRYFLYVDYYNDVAFVK